MKNRIIVKPTMEYEVHRFTHSWMTLPWDQPVMIITFTYPDGGGVERAAVFWETIMKPPPLPAGDIFQERAV